VSFDHSDAAAQVAGNIAYAGHDCTLSGRAGSFKVLFDREDPSVDLSITGTSESVEVDASFIKSDFPEPPTFGAKLTRTADGARYQVGASAHGEGLWRVRLTRLDLSTTPINDPFPA